MWKILLWSDETTINSLPEMLPKLIIMKTKYDYFSPVSEFPSSILPQNEPVFHPDLTLHFVWSNDNKNHYSCFSDSLCFAYKRDTESRSVSERLLSGLFAWRVNAYFSSVDAADFGTSDLGWKKDFSSAESFGNIKTLWIVNTSVVSYR